MIGVAPLASTPCGRVLLRLHMFRIANGGWLHIGRRLWLRLWAVYAWHGSRLQQLRRWASGGLHSCRLRCRAGLRRWRLQQLRLEGGRGACG